VPTKGQKHWKARTWALRGLGFPELSRDGIDDEDIAFTGRPGESASSGGPFFFFFLLFRVGCSVDEERGGGEGWEAEEDEDECEASF